MSHPASARHKVESSLLWFGIFGAPVFWSLQLLVIYAMIAHGCLPGPDTASGLNPAILQNLSLIVTTVAIAGSLAAAWASFSAWRGTHHEPAASHTVSHISMMESGEGRTRFMAFAGILMSGVFLLAVLFTGLPLLILPACE